MKRVLERLVMLAWLPLALLLASGTVAGANDHAALVLAATGKVLAVDAAGQTRALSRRAPVYVGDTVVTAEGAVAQLKFTDGSLLAMKADSQLRIERYSTREGSGVDAFGVSVLKGGFRSLTGAIGKRSPEEYRVGARVATIGIRGTDYEIDLDLDNGLGLGVWNGAIEACNDGGCLELGAGEPFRFGFVPIGGGAPEGRLSAPAGVGGGTVPPPQAAAGANGGGTTAEEDALAGGGVIGDGARNDGNLPFSPGTDISAVLNPILDPEPPVTPTEPIDPTDPTDPTDPVDTLRQSYPYVALGVGRASDSPLGSIYMAEYAALDYSAEPVPVPNGFRLIKGDQSAVWLAGADTLYPDDGTEPTTPVWWGLDWQIGHQDSTKAFALLAMPYASALDGEPLATAALAVGGQYVTPEVQSSMAGYMQLALSPNPYASAIWGSSMLHVLEGTGASGNDDTVDASLNLMVDFYTARATGSFSFSDAVGRWLVPVDGAFTTAGLSMTIAADAGAALFQPWQEASTYGATGSLAARFVGQTTVDGLVGAFRLTTDPVLSYGGPVQAAGVFVAEPYQLPARVDFPLHALAVSTTAGTALGDIYHAGFGVLDSTPSPVNPMVEEIYDYGFTVDGMSYLAMATDPTQVDGSVAEGWRVANQTLVGFVRNTTPEGMTYGDLVWGAPVPEAVFGVFGDYIHPEVVSALTGTMSFQLGVDSIDQPALRYAQDGVVATQSSAWLSLDVDFTQATASGGLYISDSVGDWNLQMNGAVASNGLNLSIVPGAGGSGSTYTLLGETVQDVTGSVGVIFAGKGTVDAVLGAFRAEAAAVPGLAGHTIHGAFIGTPYLPQ